MFVILNQYFESLQLSSANTYLSNGQKKVANHSRQLKKKTLDSRQLEVINNLLINSIF